MTTSRPSLRRQVRRQRKSYRDPTTDSEDDLARTLPTRSLPTRASRALHVAYGVDQSSSDTSTSADESEQPALQPRIPRTPLPKLHRTRSTTRASSPAFRAFKRRKVSPSSQVKHVPNNTKPIFRNVQASGKSPPWQTLPHHILTSIMCLAAYPLYIGASKDTGSTRWLLETSLLSTSFHSACIDALMYSPPTFPSHRAHWLIELLKASARDHGDMSSEQDNVVAFPKRRQLSVDYRKKVKSLDIEVKQILVKKAGIELKDILRHTPLLKHLRLYHNYDSLSYRYVWAQSSHVRSNGRWTYGDLFQNLDHYGIMLSSFEWNGRFMMTDELLLQFLKASSESRCLSRLRSITIRNLNLPETDTMHRLCTGSDLCFYAQELEINAGLATVVTWRNHVLKALSISSDLEEITLCDSNIFDDNTIAHLPPCLKRLEIVNCAFVKSEGVDGFLQANDGSLTSLVLRGNQSMSLEFMKDLSNTAPRLQTLDVDLTFHDPTSFCDTEPLFDDLLPSGPPTWPSSLQSISIEPLRNLSVEDATSFYQSLIDSAPTLSHLRILRLRTILSKAGWRDRASLRQEWDTKFNETFHVKFNTEANLPSLSSADSQGRKSRRLHEQIEIGSSNHGRCHTVLFELSDQRPAQDQFTEGDFLDDPDDADDVEWNEKDDIAPPKYSNRRYAW